MPPYCRTAIHYDWRLHWKSIRPERFLLCLYGPRPCHRPPGVADEQRLAAAGSATVSDLHPPITVLPSPKCCGPLPLAPRVRSARLTVSVSTVSFITAPHPPPTTRRGFTRR